MRKLGPEHCVRRIQLKWIVEQGDGALIDSLRFAPTPRQPSKVRRPCSRPSLDSMALMPPRSRIGVAHPRTVLGRSTRSEIAACVKGRLNRQRLLECRRGVLQSLLDDQSAAQVVLALQLPWGELRCPPKTLPSPPRFLLRQTSENCRAPRSQPSNPARRQPLCGRPAPPPSFCAGGPVSVPNRPETSASLGNRCNETAEDGLGLLLATAH